MTGDGRRRKWAVAVAVGSRRKTGDGRCVGFPL